MTLIRTFVAIDVSPETQARAGKLIDRLRAAEAKVSWTRPENLHLTLKFLGDTPDRRIGTVCKAVAEAAAAFPPISLHLRGAGAFPRVDRPRTVWIGVDQGAAATVELQNAIEERLYEAGFPPERRRFVPHLTLGRVRSGGASQASLGELIAANADYDAATTIVNEVIIYASILEKTGATYQVLGRAPLTGPAG